MYLWLADLKDGHIFDSLEFGDIPTSSFFVVLFKIHCLVRGAFQTFFFQESCSLFTPFFTLFFLFGGKDEQNTIFYEQTSFSNRVEGKETPPTTVDNL